MPEFEIPGGFSEEVSRREGDAGRAWLAKLPGRVEHHLGEWSLTPDGATLYGFSGVVLPVRRADGEPAVLKVRWIDVDTRDEPLALSTWNGKGAVLLLARSADNEAMLLERLDSGRSLEHEPLDEAVAITSRRLAELSVPAPPGLARTLKNEAARWVEELPPLFRRHGDPVPKWLLDRAIGFARERGPEAPSLLVSQDLHFDNMLAGTREPWLAIDPQPIAGEPEFGVISMMWNRSKENPMEDRFDAIVSGGGFDAELARGWTLLRLVENWSYALEDDDPSQLDWLAPIRAWAGEL